MSKILDSSTCVVSNSTISIFNPDLGKKVKYQAPDNTEFENGDRVRVCLSPASFTIGGRKVVFVGSREELWLEHIQ